MTKPKRVEICQGLTRFFVSNQWHCPELCTVNDKNEHGRAMRWYGSFHFQEGLIYQEAIDAGWSNLRNTKEGSNCVTGEAWAWGRAQIRNLVHLARISALFGPHHPVVGLVVVVVLIVVVLVLLPGQLVRPVIRILVPVWQLLSAWDDTMSGGCQERGTCTRYNHTHIIIYIIYIYECIHWWIMNK